MNSLIVALTFAVTNAVSINQPDPCYGAPCSTNLGPDANGINQSGIVFNLCAEDVPTTGTLDISQCWTCGSGCGTDQPSCDLV